MCTNKEQIHFVGQQKLTQHCKADILQLQKKKRITLADEIDSKVGEQQEDKARGFSRRGYGSSSLTGYQEWWPSKVYQVHAEKGY